MPPSVASADAARRPAPGRDLRAPLPSWPITAVVAGYPLWWALGLGLVMPLALSGLMAAMLMARRRIDVVPGVVPFLAFCLWVVPCGLMIDSHLRLLGFGLRSAQFFSGAVVLLYVVNARRSYDVSKLVRDLTFLWVCVVIGGYAGMLLPDLRLTTLPGLVAPQWLTDNELLHDTFFPPMAEVQHPWGSPEAFNRPAAPFPYSNNWGGAIALLTPVALAALGTARTTFRRVAIGVVLAASLLPIGASSNRGMFLALAGAMLYVGVRIAFRGYWIPLLGLSIVSLGGVIYYFAAAAQQIETRQTYSHSTEGRRQLYAETLARTVHSPFHGYGAPHPTTSTDVSLGTQGYIWELMFSFGFVGLGLFLWFLVGAVCRTWRWVPGTRRLLIHGSLVAVCIMIAYYGLHIAQLMAVLVIAGVLLRDRHAAGAP